MKKILLLTFLSFCLSTNITTKEFTVQIDETTESIDIANYLDLESGYYLVKLAYVNLIDTDYSHWAFRASGIEHHGNISVESDDGGEELSALIYYIGGRNTTISAQNSTLTGNEEGENLISGGETDLELILHVSGRFEDNSQTGDMNFDGDINVLDVIALVNVILDDDLGDIFDVIGLINKVG